MIESDSPVTPAATEPARVLNCVFEAWTVLGDRNLGVEDVSRRLVEIIPNGMTYPDACRAQITCDNFVAASAGFRLTAGGHTALLRIHDRIAGAIVVNYLSDDAAAMAAGIQAAEARMIDAIADRLGRFITLRQALRPETDLAGPGSAAARPVDPWRALLGMMRRGDLELFFRLSHKMVVHLCLSGVTEAEHLLAQRRGARPTSAESALDERSQARMRATETVAFGDGVFQLAERSLLGDEIFRCLQRWIHEERCHRFMRTLINPDSSLAAIAEGISEMRHGAREDVAISGYLQKAARVHLIQRFLSTQLDYIRIAKNHLVVEDFEDVLPRMIQPPGSQGQLGAKAAALLLAARVLTDAARTEPALQAVKSPRTWYLTTDSLFTFLCYNDLEDVMEQKYKNLEQVRREYPLIRELLCHSRFPPSLRRGLGAALEDLGPAPLAVRSSSLLEDPLNARFLGKYPNQWLANRGSVSQRLEVLTSAVAAVYASVFSPDPIEHRVAEGFIDFEEDMGVLIQPAVGARSGPYSLPLFTAIATRRREPGSVRATVCVFPGLAADDQAGRENAAVTIQIGSAPNDVSLSTPRAITQITALNCETGVLEAVAAGSLPAIVQDPGAMAMDAGLVPVVRAALAALDTAFEAPMEIEFASDGQDLYLLHCRRSPRVPA